MSALKHFAFALTLLIIFTVPALAQVDTGAVVGTIVDSQQQRIPDATVRLIQAATNVERTATSDHDGNFSFSPVAIGTYSVAVEHEGFERYIRTGIMISAQTTAQVDAVLRIGQVSQSVEVAADAPLLETQTSSLQQVVNGRSITDLPLNGRNVTFLAQTAPGVTFAQADSRGLSASGSFSANGARRGQNDYLLDGIDNNAAIADYVNQTQYVIMPPPDALQEFVVQTNNYSAEFGHSAGAVLNVSTKSASRAVTSGRVDATTGLIATSTSFVRDPFYQGPLAGHKNFTAAAQKALLNQLRANRMNSSALALLNLYPAATGPGITNNYNAFPTATNNSDGFDVRIDQHFGEHDSAFARYSYLNTDQLNPGPFSGVADGQSSRPGKWSHAGAECGRERDSHLYSPLVNEAPFGYSRVADIRRQPFATDLGIPDQHGIGGIPQFAENGGLPLLTFGNLAYLGQAGSLSSNKASNVIQLSDNVTISRNRHVVRTGVLYQNIAYPTSTPSSARGTFGFSGIYTSVVNQTDGSTDRAQFLLNPTASSIPGGSTMWVGPTA